MTRNEFEYYRAQLEAEGIDAATDASREWFLSKIEEMRTDVDRSAIRQQLPIAANELQGHMLLFNYRPANRVQLPYYDSFPLVILLDIQKDHFLGLNMHYLPIDLRQRLFYGVVHRRNTKTLNERTRLLIDYNYLKGRTNLRAFRACTRRYRYDNIIGKTSFVRSYEWEVALHLPLAVWRKAGESRVHKDSRIIARKLR